MVTGDGGFKKRGLSVPSYHHLVLSVVVTMVTGKDDCLSVP